MKMIRSIIAFLLSIVIVLGTAACVAPKDNNTSPGSSVSSQGGYSSSTEDDYNSAVDDLEEEGETGGEFDNTSNTDTPTPTPGETYDEPVVTPVVDAEEESATTPETDTEKESNKAVSRGFVISALAYVEDLQYFYEGSNYAYGIDSKGMEYIAFKSENGEMLDVVSGGGKFSINSTRGVSLLKTETVESFNVFMKDSFEAVTVTYKLSGLSASNSIVETTYTFEKKNISVSSRITTDSENSVISVENSGFFRTFICDVLKDEVAINSEWVYPADGDYPYPDFESLAFKTKIHEDIMMYSFMRGDGIATVYRLADYSSSNMPITAEETNGLFYTHEYDLAFVDTLTENLQSADYIGLFKSRGSDFATGVAPVKDTGDNSSVFIGNSVDLNINVTNLIDSDLKFSLRYDIRDYYGNVVDKGIFVDSTVYQYTDANRTVKVTGPYGMYFLNLYVISRNSTYAECYPFMLLEDYTYKYNATSPFGINSPWRHHESVTANTAKIYAKLGVATTRINSDDVNLAKELHKLGITQINGIVGKVNREENTNDSFVKQVVNTVDVMKDYIDSFEVGNEMNLDTIGVANEEQAVDELYRLFYNFTYLPSRKLFDEKYPNIGYIPTPFSAGQVAWVKRVSEGYLDDIDGDGQQEVVGNILKDIDIISTHIYGTPWMPDQYSTYEPEWGKATWCIEGALQRLDECLTNFCENKTDVDLYITELGYNTRPQTDIDVCLRTQADYIARSMVLASAYGADRIQVYNMYDRRNWYSGFDNTYDQLNFGVFYDADYYNRLLPKPAAAAFAVLTRQLESLKKNRTVIFDKYDEGWDFAGVRAFKFETALKGDVVVAWSNSEILTNGKKNSLGSTGDRVPTLPWNNQWLSTDDTVFDAVGETVQVVDIMGNTTVYKARDGKVSIPLTGSPVYISGVK